MKMLRTIIGVFSVLCLLCLGCGEEGGNKIQAKPNVSSTTVPLAATKPEASREAGQKCTVTDSNGPLEGGELVTQGCSAGQSCVCTTQAGYSCSGTCR
jgi:hypothetical protein